MAAIQALIDTLPPSEAAVWEDEADVDLNPRIGFNWDVRGDESTQLRGGVGLFQGGSPNVWLAGAYQNTGLNYLEYDLSSPGAIFTDEVDPPYYPATPTPAQCTPTPTLNNCARQNVDFIEEGFELPSVWKANLAFEHELPFWGALPFVIMASALIGGLGFAPSANLGEDAAISSNRSNATSTAIKAPVLPGLPTGFTRGRLFQMGNEITRSMARVQLFGQDPVPSGTHRIGRTWQATDQRTVGQAGQRPGLNG